MRRPEDEAGVKFMISVPKKRLRHATDRVTMRRRCREAYRLNRHLLPETPLADLAFIYVADKLTPYAMTDTSVRRILQKLALTIAPQPDHTLCSEGHANV